MTNELILFADNDMSFVDVRKQFLIRAGYRVLITDNFDDAKKILDTRNPDLAIIDMRLIDDMQEDDFSGIQLARNSAPNIPKIILTSFPTWQAVRDALAIVPDGSSPAVELLAKNEGADALLRSIDWILHKQELRKNIVDSFGVSTLMAVPDKITSLGFEESGLRLHNSLSNTAEQWISIRTSESKRASNFHNLGLLTALISIILLFSSVILALLGRISLPVLPVIFGGLTQAVSTFFFVREDKANSRVQECTTKLDEINKLENLLVICDSLDDKQDREACRRKVIEKILELWL